MPYKVTHTSFTFLCDYCDNVYETEVKCVIHEREHRATKIEPATGVNEPPTAKRIKREVTSAAVLAPITTEPTADDDVTLLSDDDKSDQEIERAMSNPVDGTSDSDASASPSTPSARVRTYACRVCDKPLNSVAMRTRHERKHSEPRPFKCDDCGETFRRREHLQRHVCPTTDEPVRTHTPNEIMHFETGGANYPVGNL
jgi:hypothetical protein